MRNTSAIRNWLVALAMVVAAGAAGPFAHGQTLCRTTGPGVIHMIVTITVVGYDGCPGATVGGRIYGPGGDVYDFFDGPIAAGTSVVYQKDYTSTPRSDWGVGMSGASIPAGGTGCPARSSDVASVVAANVPPSAGNEIYLSFRGTVTITPQSITLVYAPMSQDGCAVCAAGQTEVLESCTTPWGEFWTKERYCGNGQWETASRACPMLTTNDCRRQVNCSSCPPGTTTAKLHSIEIATSLGGSSFGGSAGTLQITADAPEPSLSTPARLAFVPGSGGAWLIYGADNALRQVRTDQVLADVVTLDNYRYEIRFFALGDAGPKIGTLYEPSGTPFETVVIENPDASPTVFNRLRVRESVAGKLSDYTWTESTQQWQLNTGNASRRETRMTAWDSPGINRTDTIILRNGDNQVVGKTLELLRVFAWGTNLVGRIADPDGAALTNTWSYYEDPANDGPNYGRLRQTTEPRGYWERYEYDATGRRTKTVAQFRDAPADAGESACRVVEYGYAPVDPADLGTTQPDVPRTTVVKLLGREIGRSYNVVSPAEQRRIECVMPGAAWDAADNLVTVTRRYASGPFAGETQSVRYPDGTARLYEYAAATDGSAKTTTVYAGAANAPGDAVTNGTKTVTVVDRAGNAVLDESYDVATGWLLSRTSTVQTDLFGRATLTVSLSGTNTFTYGCCGVLSATDEEGIVSTYQYDDLRRLSATTRGGIKMEHRFDPEGRVLDTIRWGSSGEAIFLESTRYDLAGRPVTVQDALRHTTRYVESRDAGGYPVETTTYPDQTTQVTTYYPDGQVQSVTGTAVHGVRYEYDVEIPPGETTPRAFTRTIRLNADGTDSTEWAKSYVDLLGRAYQVVYPGNVFSQSYYNGLGQLVKEVDPDGVTTLYAYSDLGEPEFTVLDMDRNGAIDLDGTDRITRTRQSVVQAHGTTVRRTTTTVFTIDGADSTNVAGITDSSVDGLQSWTIRHGLTNGVQTVYDRARARRTATETAADGTRTISVHENSRLASVTTTESQTNVIQSVSYSYDQHGRMAFATDVRAGSTSWQYNGDDQVEYETTPPPKPGESALTTRYEYDSQGRLRLVTLPDGNQVWYECLGTGELKKLWGARAYPVEYSYDYAGRLQTLKTWQNYNARSGAAVTTWNYDPQRGFLASKRYADGRGPDYSYTAAGRLLTRTWARGITTTYSYNRAGETESVQYSDGTPALGFTYDRRGRCVAVTGSDPVEWAYNEADQLQSETYTGGALAGLRLSIGYDALGRRSALAVRQNGQPLAVAAYGYDPAGRLAAVSDGTHSASYGYVPKSSLVGTIVHARGAATALTATKTYDNLNRLRSLVSRDGQSAVVDSRTYSFNAASQRSRADLSDGSYWSYGYDPLGQLTSARRYWANGTAVAGQQFDYSFDDIGNRATATVNGRVATYTANALNQYTQRTVPGAVDIIGSATSNATVTVNTQAVTRQGDYFHRSLDVSNGSAAAYPKAKIIAVKNNVGPQGEDAITYDTGHLFVPKTPESFSYDLDGNLTGDGRWTNTWDAENRLIAMETDPAVAGSAVPRQRLEFHYDSLGRRISKKVYTWNSQTTSYQLQAATLFLHDGANLVAELDANAPVAPTLLRSYLWGLDLSDTPQGAGGVGGLLAVTEYQPLATTCFTAYDGQGNVTALVSAEDTAPTARYEYGPFGEHIRRSGSAAKANVIQFGTKPSDPETELGDYGERFYNSSIARWLSRDPIDEAGGLNVYTFVRNGPLNFADPNGLLSIYLDGTWNYTSPDGRVSTDPRPTNVWKMWNASQDGNAFYYGGIGNSVEYGWAKEKVGGFGGWGGKDILQRAYNDIVKAYNSGDHEISMIGFSRGAALTLELANMVADGIAVTDELSHQKKDANGNPLIWCNVKIKFVGLFDVVGSFGLPGNDVNPGYRLYLPKNIPIDKAVHAVAMNETRNMFPVTDVQGALQVGFPGVHSDVGGSELNEGLSNLSLLWMMNEARAGGLGFKSNYDNVTAAPNMNATDNDTWYYRNGPRKMPSNLVNWTRMGIQYQARSYAGGKRWR